MIFLFIGILIGYLIGYKINNLVRKLNEGITYKLFGYSIYIERKQKTPVVKMQPKKKKAPAMKLDSCETCNNEDMFIAGTKHLIACPKCKRNSNKFNKRSV